MGTDSIGAGSAGMVYAGAETGAAGSNGTACSGMETSALTGTAFPPQQPRILGQFRQPWEQR